MKLKAFLILLLIPFAAQSQKIEETVFNKALHDKIYVVEFGDRQVLELIRFHGNNVSGTLTNAVWKYSKSGKDAIIIQKINLPDTDAKSLFADLEQNNFDTLPDGDCQGADGGMTTFISQNADRVNDASYWELTSDYCQQEASVYAKILKARVLTAAIEKYIHIKEAFKAFTDTLPKGKYTYGMIVLEKK